MCLTDRQLHDKFLKRGSPGSGCDQNGAVQSIPTQMQRGLTKGSVRKSRTERRTAACVRTGSAARARRFRSKTVWGLPPKKPNSGSNRRPRRLGLRRLVAHGSIAGARRSFWIQIPRRRGAVLEHSLNCVCSLRWRRTAHLQGRAASGIYPHPAPPPRGSLQAGAAPATATQRAKPSR